jgi:hypothetical protein
MAFTLETVVPWGRSFDEYHRMFALTDPELQQRILGCADGPASFNAELTAAGGTVTSCDPLYRLSADEIRQRIGDTSAEMIEQTWANAGTFIWSGTFIDPDALARHRLATMDRFLSDYEKGRTEGRYVAAELPTLPFAENGFDIALCSHFLFLYSKHLSEQFHVAAVRNLIRSAHEVRIFPVTELAAVPSRHVKAVSAALRVDGFRVVIETVNYEFQRGANQMMRILR